MHTPITPPPQTVTRLLVEDRSMGGGGGGDDCDAEQRIVTTILMKLVETDTCNNIHGLLFVTQTGPKLRPINKISLK